MDDGLTFKFVLTDEGPSAQQAPPDATPGAATRSRPMPPDEPPPAPRQPPPEAAGPTPRPAAQPGSSAPEPSAKESPVDRSDDRPPRRRSAPAAEQSVPAPRKPPATKAETQKPGEAAKLLGELVKHLSQVPGIGRAIGSLYHVVEPLVDARKQIQQIRDKEAKQEAGPSVVPISRPQARPTITPLAPAEVPQPRPPSSGFRIAGDPGQQAAIQKLIAALGPLPEGNRELREALKPLTSLGYTIGELLAAVKSMRRETEERTPGVEGARPAEKTEAPQPQSQPAESSTPQRRPAQPADKIDLTDRDKPAPRPVPTTPPEPTPTPGGATAAMGEAAEAEAAPAAGAASAAAEGTAAAGGALGPAGLVAGIAVVATVGAATRAFSALIKTTKALDHSFTETSHRLAAYSGAIAAAEANAQARRVVNDVGRANRLGGRLGDFTDERAQMSRSLDNILDAFRGAALDEVVPLMKILNKVLEPIADNSETIEKAISAVLGGPLLKKLVEFLGINIDEKRKKELDDLSDIMGIFQHIDSGKSLHDYDPRGALGGFGSIDNPLTPPGLGI